MNQRKYKEEGCAKYQQDWHLLLLLLLLLLQLLLLQCVPQLFLLLRG